MSEVMQDAILYIRVSTTDQAEFGHSLDAQERICRDYAKRHGYNIVEVFREEGESAKTIDRTQLKRLLDFISKKPGRIKAILVYKLDRLARSMVDFTGLVALFSKLGIDIKSATENIDNTPAGKLTKNMIAAIAQFDNDVRSERTKSGMMQALLEGRWVWAAPLGYKYRPRKDKKERPFLIPSDYAPIIVVAFEMLATGLYQQMEIVTALHKKGYEKVNKTRLNAILRNYLYAGMIKVNWFPQVIEAIHEPLIPKDLFFKVQAILDGKRPTVTPKSRNNPLYPLRGLMLCPYCGGKMTAGGSTRQKGGKKHPYYHCWKKGCPGCSLNIKKKEMEEKFYEYLKLFEPTEEALKLFEATVIDVWKTLQAEQMKTHAQLEKRLRELQEERTAAEKLVMKGVFNEVAYKRQSEEIENKILVTQLELNEARIEINDIEACLNYCRYFLTHIAELWLSADLDSKQRLQSLIFPAKVTYKEDGTLGTTATASIFKRLDGKVSRESNLVAPTGFEPVFNG